MIAVLRRHLQTGWRAFVPLALAVGLLASDPAVAGAGNGITVVSNTSQNSYPANVRFDLEAQSSNDITKVTLRYKLGYRRTTSYHPIAIQPGPKVTAQYVWNTQRQHVPPGVDIEYYWQIEDAAGNRAETQPAKITTTDTRFTWQGVESSGLTLYWHAGERRFAQDLLDAGTRAIGKLRDEVGAELDRPVRLFIYEQQKDLLGALAPRDVEWAGGQAFPEEGVIALSADASEQGKAWGLRVVPHELSHLVVHVATDGPFGGVPAWLDEGLAVYAEGPPDPQMANLLKLAVSSGTLLSLQSISGKFPTDDRLARLAYAESNSVVRYLLATYGRDKMSGLLGVFRQGSTPDAALKSVYGLDTGGLEGAWRASVGAPVALPTPSLGPNQSRPSQATTEPSDANPQAQPAAPPTPAGSASSAPSGRSCFGGLLIITSGLAGLVLLGSRRGIANESRDRI